MIIYLIRNVNDEDLYWSNFDGWVELDGYPTVFTENEYYDVSLPPMEGEWVKFIN